MGKSLSSTYSISISLISSLRSTSELCFSVGRLIDLPSLCCRRSKRQLLIQGWAKKEWYIISSVKGVLFDHGKKWKNQIPPSRNSNLLFVLCFNFTLGSYFLFLCFKLIIIHYHTPKQRKIKFEPRIKFKFQMKEGILFEP